MENAPIITAYDHAKTASLHTYKGSLNAARESHTHAAGDFASAYRSSHDIEAQRVLHLLEEHHLQLAKALATTTSVTESKHGSTQEKTTGPPNLAMSASTRRPPRRELSSSIASNLATARGKPGTTSRRPPPSEVSDRRTTRQNFPPGLPPPLPTTATTRTNVTQHQHVSSDQPSSDGNFNTFISSFENFFSKLSAPLAFTGLPLTSDTQPDLEAAKSAASKSKRHRATRATTNPDLSTIFSAPALRALKDDAGPLVQESFYVVQPGSSYSRTQSDMDSDGEFVDARESLSGRSQSPKLERNAQKKGKHRIVPPAVETSPGGKTLEELELENASLRDLVDRQSRRLLVWEQSSQQQTMALHRSTMLTSRSGGNASAATAAPVMAESERIRQLEELVTAERIERETLDRLNIKLQKENERLVVINGRYKDKWNQLKENARQKDRKRKEEERKVSVGENIVVPPAP